MKDERIKLETGKLLKEKGFNEYVDVSYTQYLTTKIDPEYPEGGGPFGWTKGEIEVNAHYFKNNDKNFDYSNENYGMYAIPTQSIVQKWLREKFQIQVYVVPGTITGKKIPYYTDYVGHVCVASEGGVGKVVSTAINDPRDEEFSTYEEAMEAALINALHRIS